MNKGTLKYIGILTGVALLVLLAACPGFSQTYWYSGDGEDRAPQKIFIDLNSDDQDLADEYLDIIEQLKEIIEDYTDYLLDMETDSPCDDRINFKVFEKGLASGLYAEDIRALKEDIEYYIEDLGEIQKDYKKGKDGDGRHCYRISRSLIRELSILNNLIDQNISNRIVQKLHNKEFQLYLQESILKFAEKLKDSLDLTDLEEQIESLGVQIEVMDFENLEIPAIPPVTPIPKTPDVPDTEKPRVQTRVYIHDRSNEESGLAKVFTSYKTVSSFKEPIHITNPVGDITINGGDKANIKAEFNIEISADSRVREKDFINSTNLTIEHDKNAYFVTVTLPQLKDPQTKVLNSNLVVSLPSQNAVFCNNAFGRIAITNLHNGLTLDANHSEIAVSDIEGPVDITNSMNDIVINNVNGHMKITNSNNPITIRDCVGDLNISNAYARVSVISSNGQLIVNNSGQTEVEGHTGDVNINNSYGLIKVDNLFGDLAVTNAFSPIETREIKGSVSLGNTYALIAAVDIEGELNITNNHGRIDARYFNGPVNINSKNGDVNVLITQPLKGQSRISTFHGSMNVAIGESSDVWMKVRTNNGEIQSAYPLNLIDQDSLVTGEFKFGKALDSLMLVGNNSSIIIKDSR